MSKPVLLVDIDGVLNCFGGIWTQDYEAEAFDHVGLVNGYVIRIPKGTRDRLAKLGKAFEMHWGTMWMEQAHPSFWELLDLPQVPWPHVDFTKASLAGTKWGQRAETHKLPGVAAYAEGLGPRALAWIDDDLQPNAFGWAERRTQEGAPTRFVKTNPSQGLGDEHVEELLAFASEIR